MSMRHKMASESALTAEIHILHPFLSGQLNARMPVPGVDYCAACRQAAGPARDFFDFVPLGGDTLVMAIGHAFGAGSSTTLSTAGLQRLMRGLTAANCGQISRVVESMNRAICAVSPDPFYTTLFYGWIEPLQSRLHFVSAAHEPAILISDGGSRVRLLEHTGAFLGLKPDAPFRQESVSLEPGDVLVALSGAKNDLRRQERAVEIVREDPNLRAATLAARILDEMQQAVSVVRFQGRGEVELWDASAEEPLLAAS
jgi:serine phosphatase RsbU (regulator of sigma subunit)